MPQGSPRLRSVLSKPWVYRSFIHLVGGNRAYRVFLSEYVGPWRGARLLDIGCGPGHLLRYLSDVEYVGFDVDPAYVESARRHYGDRGTFYSAAVGSPLPLLPGSFDIAVAFGVLHHLDDDRASLLFETARLFLKAGGRLVTCDGCWADGQSSAARWLLSRDRGQHIRTLPELLSLAMPHFSRVEGGMRDDLLRVPYSHGLLTCHA